MGGSGTGAATSLHDRAGAVMVQEAEIFRTPGSDFYTRAFIIRKGASISEPLDLGGRSRIFAFHFTELDGATSLTFQVAPTIEGRYNNFYDDAGTEVAITVAANRAVGMDDRLPEFLAVRFVKVRLGSSASPVVATVDRSIVLLVRELPAAA